MITLENSSNFSQLMSCISSHCHSSFTKYRLVNFLDFITAEESQHYNDIRWLLRHSDHQQLDCLLNSLLKPTTEKTLKLCMWEESIDDQWIPSQRASNVESVSISWCHHEDSHTCWLHLIFCQAYSCLTSSWLITHSSHQEPLKAGRPEVANCCLVFQARTRQVKSMCW